MTFPLQTHNFHIQKLATVLWLRFQIPSTIFVKVENYKLLWELNILTACHNVAHYFSHIHFVT